MAEPRSVEPEGGHRQSARSWTTTPPNEWSGDARRLGRALTESLDGSVGFDAGSRAIYATDASNYRQPPIGVVWPRHAEDVERTVRLCREAGAPILGRGGGTSLAGQCCNLAVVLDFSRHMNRVLEIDPDARTARVEPGTVLDVLRDRAREHGLTFGPDPATHTHCTLGGMIGNDSCGIHSVQAGRTADNVRSLEVLTYRGDRFRVGATGESERAAIAEAGGRRAWIHRELASLAAEHAEEIRRRFPDIPRRVSGYNLDELLPENGFQVARSLVGSEGTCALILEAELDLIPEPAERVLVVAAFRDAYAAADCVPELLELGPIGLEGLDGRLIRDQRAKGMHPEDLALLPGDGEGWLLIELGGDQPGEARDRAEEVRRLLRGVGEVRAVEVFTDSERQERIWEVRESGLGATARVPGQGDTWPGWEDSAVPPERFGEYLRDFRKLLDEHGFDGAFYGHFGDGCLHTRIDFDLRSAHGLERYRELVDQAADLVVSYGGSLSGEHGDGQSRGELLPKMYGDRIVEAFRRFKAIWDPDGRMNPGKVCDPYPVLSNLRLGTGYRPWEPRTDFAYPDDDRRFSRAALRCVGVGKCRREGGGTMCPSYMVTREEKHSTRGRARLLWEMLEGDVISDGWRSREVEEALDLCLSCKGCKSDCPVGVDMATYKAEFLSHRYAGRLRPRAAYSMGLIPWWARLGSRVARLANGMLALPGIGGALKWAAGIDRRRPAPRFAPVPYRRRASTDGAAANGGAGGRRVVLWPDTFNDFFHPDVLEAGCEVLEAAGFAVEPPPERICCGRPLYDFGMLGLARRQLERIVDSLRPAIREGVPVVGLEPSCVAVFRDELAAMLPDDEDARRLSKQVLTLGELLDREAGDFAPPPLGRRALVHGHCHQKAIVGLDAEEKLYRRLGLDFEVLDSGCCGMAGAFGFERGKYEVSVACGERALLPAVRAADPETLVIADGFSCRTQIADLTGRRALHTAQVARLALSGDAGAEEQPSGRLAALAALGLVAAGTAWLLRRRRRG